MMLDSQSGAWMEKLQWMDIAATNIQNFNLINRNRKRKFHTQVPRISIRKVQEKCSQDIRNLKQVRAI